MDSFVHNDGFVIYDHAAKIQIKPIAFDKLRSGSRELLKTGGSAGALKQHFVGYKQVVPLELFTALMIDSGGVACL
jgi:hypothetical protein